MSRENTDTFTHELPLKTNKFQEKKLAIKFRSLRELYNTVLNEIFIREKLLEKDGRYEEALRLYRKDNSKKQAKIIFNQLKKDYLLQQYDIQAFATKIKNISYMKDHLDGDTTQVISDRAYDAYMKYKTKKRGKPRFKSFKLGLRSISGKKNMCVSFTKKGQVKWTDLLIDVIYDKKDKHGVQFHALSKKIKYCRILTKFIRGKQRYFLQLVLEGFPKIKDKNIYPDKNVGLDVGVSTVAAINNEQAILTPFCAELKTIHKQIKKLQRKNSRSMRSMNNENFEPDFYKRRIKKLGKIIKGKKVWVNSKRYNKRQNEIKELHRIQADKRKMLHNILANEVLSLGKFVKIENNNYKAWQKGWFGKTIGFRAPSTFVSILTRKAESAGGRVDLIDTWTSKLSQYCHVCDGYHKKKLSERIHTCGKITVQRDLYSALLIKHYVLEDKKVNRKSILKNWRSFDTILNSAVLTCSNKFRVVDIGTDYAIVPASLGIQDLEKRNLHEKAVVVRDRGSCEENVVQERVTNKNRTP